MWNVKERASRFTFFPFLCGTSLLRNFTVLFFFSSHSPGVLFPKKELDDSRDEDEDEEDSSEEDSDDEEPPPKRRC